MYTMPYFIKKIADLQAENNERTMHIVVVIQFRANHFDDVINITFAAHARLSAFGVVAFQFVEANRISIALKSRFFSVTYK